MAGRLRVTKTTWRRLEHGWDLALKGAVIDRVGFDSGLHLRVRTDAGDVDVEAGGNIDVIFGDGARYHGEFLVNDFGAVELLLRLRFQSVVECIATDDGHLKIDFGDVGTLTAYPDSDVEAWQVSGCRGELAVAVPGGGVAVFDSAAVPCDGS